MALGLGLQVDSDRQWHIPGMFRMKVTQGTRSDCNIVTSPWTSRGRGAGGREDSGFGVVWEIALTMPCMSLIKPWKSSWMRRTTTIRPFRSQSPIPISGLYNREDHKRPRRYHKDEAYDATTPGICSAP